VGGAAAPSGSSLHRGRARAAQGDGPGWKCLLHCTGPNVSPQERIEFQAFQVLGHAEVEVCPLQGLLGVFSSG